MNFGLARWIIGFGVLCLGFASPALADWKVAQSERFVVYSESRTDDVRKFAEMLEKFHRAMEIETRRSLPVPSPSNRVSVYMVGSDRDLKILYGNRNTNVAGFYIPRAGGSAAFVPFIKIGSGGPDFSLTVLLHEYAHHFLLSSSRQAMPRWLSEGAAEYFASARFQSNGDVDLGLPNNERAWELSNAREVSLRELLDHELYSQRRSNSYSAFYGRSWLLYHFLRFDPDRTGQLLRYQQALSSGMSSLEAAELAFGDLDQLEDQLHRYNGKRRMAGMRFNADDISSVKVTVRALSEGVSKMMPVIIRSKRGVNSEEAAELLPEAREIAARYPMDPDVLAALAEAEYDAGNNSEAIAAADGALAIDPNNLPALVQKGLALFRVADDASDQEAAYNKAMKPFSALNALEADHPLPLIHYYRSFTNRGEMPPENARAALERAAMLAPFDHSLAMNAAIMLAGEGKPSLASLVLKPVAANPHGGSRGEFAKALIAAFDDAKDGIPFDVSSVDRPSGDEYSEDDEES